MTLTVTDCDFKCELDCDYDCVLTAIDLITATLTVTVIDFDCGFERQV